MKTIILKYDVRNISAKKAIEFILSLGCFFIENEQDIKNDETLQAFGDVELEGLVCFDTFEEYDAYVKTIHLESSFDYSDKKNEIMKTVVFNYDDKNKIAKKTIDFLLSLGVFVIDEKQTSLRNSENDKNVGRVYKATSGNDLITKCLK